MYHKKWKQKLLTKQRKTHTPIQNFTIPHKTERVTVGHVFPEYAILLGVFWQLVFLYTAHRFTDHESEGSMTPLIKTLQSVHPYWSQTRDKNKWQRIVDSWLFASNCANKNEFQAMAMIVLRNLFSDLK